MICNNVKCFCGDRNGCFTVSGLGCIFLNDLSKFICSSGEGIVGEAENDDLVADSFDDVLTVVQTCDSFCNLRMSCGTNENFESGSIEFFGCLLRGEALFRCARPSGVPRAPPPPQDPSPLRGTLGSSLRSPAEGEGHEGFPPRPRVLLQRVSRP